MKVVYTDVLVIGGGLAGLRMAIAAKRRGHDAVILSLVLLSITAHLLTRNLRKLATASVQVADGDYDVAIPTQGHDEVAVLSGNFNRMIAAIRERNKEVLFYQEQLERSNR